MQFAGELLASETNQIGTRNHGKIVENEDGEMEVCSRIGDSNCGWYHGPEDVADSGCSAGRQPADLEESFQMYALSATLSCWLNACRKSASLDLSTIIHR